MPGPKPRGTRKKPVGQGGIFGHMGTVLDLTRQGVFTYGHPVKVLKGKVKKTKRPLGDPTKIRIPVQRVSPVARPPKAPKPSAAAILAKKKK